MNVQIGPVPGLAKFLERHPMVTVSGDLSEPGLHFGNRRIIVGNPELEVRGLIELMDNNPLVCAQTASVPDPGSTLALIALEPLIRANLLVEDPTLSFSFPVDEALVQRFLNAAGWHGSAAMGIADLGVSPALGLLCLAVIESPPNPADIGGLYDEAYGRSFFVQRKDTTLTASMVLGGPKAAFSFRVQRDEPHSLISVSVISDPEGKCAGGQLVHMFNVMAGFEETLGLEG